MAVHDPLLPRLRTRVLVVLFPLAVGAILGGLPGWQICFFAWMVLAMPTLALLAFISACLLLAELYRGRRQHAAFRGWQVALSIAAMLVLPMLGRLSEFVELAGVRTQLHAQAWAGAHDGGPHIAIVDTGDLLTFPSGYVYDDSGEIAKPCGPHSDAWLRRAAAARIGDDCSMSVRHVIGPYYRWGER
jgi:hypothetical protein